MGMKRKKNLRLQVILLLLTTMVVLTAGCVKADETTPDRVDSDKKTEDAMIPYVC